MNYNVLVVVDGSGRSLNAIKTVSKMIQGIPQAVVRLLYVYPVHLTTTHSTAPQMNYQTMVTTQSEQALEESIAYLEANGISYEKIVVVGNPIQEINLNVQMYQCELVVINHKRTGNTQEALMEAVMHKVKCPILVIPD